MPSLLPQRKKIIAWVVTFSIMVLPVFVGLLIPINRGRRAQFTIDALGAYINAYQVFTGRAIDKLDDLPDFILVSKSEGFRLRSSDLKSGYFGGYIYDFENLNEGRYVLSASPLGWFSPGKEFGITHDGILRMNEIKVDGEPDSLNEVEKWQPVARLESIRTQWEPNY